MLDPCFIRLRSSIRGSIQMAIEPSGLYFTKEAIYCMQIPKFPINTRVWDKETVIHYLIIRRDILSDSFTSLMSKRQQKKHSFLSSLIGETPWLNFTQQNVSPKKKRKFWTYIELSREGSKKRRNHQNLDGWSMIIANWKILLCDPASAPPDSASVCLCNAHKSYNPRSNKIESFS